MASFFSAQSHLTNSMNIQAFQNSLIDSRILYEDVVRKYQEITKQILTRINDLYCQQEEFDTSIKLINNKIVKINEANDELCHQLKTTSFQIKRNHHNLIHDMSELKRTLNERNLTAKKEEYMDSDQNQKKKINCLPRQIQSKGFFKAKIAETVQLDAKVEECLKQKRKSQASNVAENKVYKEFDHYKDIIQKKIEGVHQNLQAIIKSTKDEIKINNMELTQLVKNLQNQLQTTLEKISAKERCQHDREQNNFRGSQKLLYGKMEEDLCQKISQKYFQESMNNLKQRWQEELYSAYEVMNQKLNQTHLRSIQQKINELKNQIQLFNNLNSMKLQNISYNSTCRSTQCLSPKKMNSLSQVQDNITKQDQSKTYKKNALLFSTSYSSLFKVKKNNQDKKNNTSDNEQSVYKWKGKVMETLGLANKKVRRVKRKE